MRERPGSGERPETPLADDAVGGAQMAFPFPTPPPCYDRAAFLIAPSNETAWRAAEAWLASDEPNLIICGPAGSGKTHLAHIIAEKNGVFVDWRSGGGFNPDIEIVVLDELPADDPRLFLSVLADLNGAGHRVVLAGEGNPGSWAQELQDLRTRLEAMPRAYLHEPDEALLRAVMTKAFGDRQISVSSGVINYAAPRLLRKFAHIHAFVAALDEAAARRGQKISIPMARETIAAMSAVN
ncbi:MAG: hypothetical protein AAGD92_05320 [Pseudomonadota bacterium]